MIALARGLLGDPEDAEATEPHTSQLEGDLLPDWYDDWLMIERERLRQLRVHALEHLAERAVREGRFGHAIDCSLAAIAADPLRESAHRILIRAYLAEGNSSAGLRQYREYCRLAHDAARPRALAAAQRSRRRPQRLRALHSRPEAGRPCVDWMR